MTKGVFTAGPGECHVCAAAGILPSQAIACVLHSTMAIDELRAEIAVLKDAASASSRLHMALADFFGSVPSPDGSQEMQSVTDLHDRLERVAALIDHVLHVAQWDDDEARALVPRLFPSRRRKPVGK